MKVKVIEWDQAYWFEKACNDFLEGKTIKEIHITSQPIDDGVILGLGQKRVHWYAMVAYEDLME